MAYTRFHEEWANLPETSTPVTAEALEHIEGGIVDASADAEQAFTAVQAVEASVADTGWVAFTPASGYESKSGDLGVRRIGKTVYCRGLIGPTSGSMPTTQTNIGTLPAGFRPSQVQWFVGGVQTGGVPDTLVVTEAGVLQYRPSPASAASSYVGLASLVFLVD